MTNQDIIRDKQERIVELEKQLAVARAKAEQLKVRAGTLQREAQTATQEATALQQQISEGETELTRVKEAPADEWEVASHKLDSMWEQLQTRVDDLASHLQRSKE